MLRNFHVIIEAKLIKFYIKYRKIRELKYNIFLTYFIILFSICLQFTKM